MPRNDKSQPVRGTQSFVRTLTSVWGRPALTAIEVAWRWVFGVPALWVIVTEVQRVLMTVTGGSMNVARIGLDHALLSDPVGALTADPAGAAGKFAGAVRAVLPGLERVGIWLAPALLLGWVVISGVGRMMLLRRAGAGRRGALWTLMGLHALRALGLGLAVLLWFWVVAAIGRGVVTGPIGRGEEPNLVLYCGLVIVTTLGMFTGWAAVNWPLKMAPVLAMSEGSGMAASLRRAVGLGSDGLGAVRGKLVEVNLVMGIVKIALLVLAMVFSATPLPFQDVATAGFLAWWWAGVGVVWLVWSDFFHVVRLVAYVDLWRAFDAKELRVERKIV